MSTAAKTTTSAIAPELQASKLVTLESFVRASVDRSATLDAQLTWVVCAIGVASRRISSKLKRARLEDILGEVGNQNVQGEAQQKLDVIANEILKQELSEHSAVATIGSEEDDELIISESTVDQVGSRYSVFFDPLDGSSNLDVAGGVGTIFSIYASKSDALEELQTGANQLCAGYVLYGSSTVLVMSLGAGVQMFVLDPSTGDFVLVEESLKIPGKGKIYSVNEANIESFAPIVRRYLDECHANGHSARYAGAMVADVHRVLLKGGVFLYPPTGSAPNGKLRLMYECNPMAMLVTQAGGKAETGSGPILDVVPSELHQRVPVFIGSRENVDMLTADD